MDLRASDEENAFRAEVRTWLNANAKPRVKRETTVFISDPEI